MEILFWEEWQKPEYPIASEEEELKTNQFQQICKI